MNEYRKKIDEIDVQIAKLLSERIVLTKCIGKEKLKNFEEIYAPDRECDVLKNVALHSGSNISYISEIYKKIFEVSRRIQEEIFRDKG